MWGYGSGFGSGFGGYWGMGIGMIGMLVFWIGIIVLAVYLFRWLGSGTRNGVSSRPGADALDVLRERYARGEIDSEEFQRRIQVLK